MQPLLNEILPLIPGFVLSISRLTGLAIYGPLLGATAIPVRIKALIITIFAIAITLVAPRVQCDLTIASMAPRMASDMMLGLIIGYVANIPMVTAQLAGLITGQQLGLGFALIYNPAADTEADSLGQMLFFLTMAAFMAIGGVESSFMALLRSYDHVPAGGFLPNDDLLALICGMLAASAEVALRISAPLLAIVFLETVTLGFLAKTMPQLNMLNIGFPIRILVGLAVMAVGLLVIQEVLLTHISDILEQLQTFIRSR